MSIIAQTTPFFDSLDRYGFPIAVLVVLAIFLWRMARWFAPIARGVVESHTDLVSVLKETGPATQRAVTKLTNTQEELVRMHHSPSTTFSTLNNSRVLRLLAIHLQSQSGGESLELTEAIRIADQAIHDAEDRARQYFEGKP